MAHPTLAVAVIMRRIVLANRWQTERWEAVEAIPDVEPPGTPPRCIERDETGERWLHPGFTAELFRDEAEGYYLNITAEQPFVFVMWRADEGAMPAPRFVTMSYGEAARLLDAQENVDGVPMPLAWCDWLAAYVQANYKPEPKKRIRPPSFKGARRDAGPA